LKVSIVIEKFHSGRCPTPGQHIRLMIAVMNFPSGADKAYGNLTCLSIQLTNRHIARFPGNQRT
jgi:hypothetical protein